MRLRAQEAERRALSSTSPQQQWELASAAYAFACRMALQSGDYQKALLYGEKALDTAHRTKEPRLFASRPSAIDLGIQKREKF